MHKAIAKYPKVPGGDARAEISSAPPPPSLGLPRLTTFSKFAIGRPRYWLIRKKFCNFLRVGVFVQERPAALLKHLKSQQRATPILQTCEVVFQGSFSLALQFAGETIDLLCEARVCPSSNARAVARF